MEDNQPTLPREAAWLSANAKIAYETHDKGHGRIEHRYYSVVAIGKQLAASLGFTSASQVVKLYRERCDLGAHLDSHESSYYVTDLSAKQGSSKELAHYIHGHWGMENRSHYVREQIVDEDLSETRVGGAAQALAALRNLAISILRLAGFTNIASGLRCMAFDDRRSLALLGL